MIKSIVVAVDGSRAARKAIDMAGDIAKSSGATVHLLHVIKEPEIPEALQEFAEVEHISGPPQAILHKAARYVLEDADTRAKAAGAPKVTTEVLMGPVARTIVSYANQMHADMIAIGHRSHTRLDELLQGGVSRRVSSLARCPCLLVN